MHNFCHRIFQKLSFSQNILQYFHSVLAKAYSNPAVGFRAVTQNVQNLHEKITFGFLQICDWRYYCSRNGKPSVSTSEFLDMDFCKFVTGGEKYCSNNGKPSVSTSHILKHCAQRKNPMIFNVPNVIAR